MPLKKNVLDWVDATNKEDAGWVDWVNATRRQIFQLCSEERTFTMTKITKGAFFHDVRKVILQGRSRRKALAVVSV